MIVSSLVLAAVLIPARPASADPNRKFAGRIMMSEKRFPLRAKSAAAYEAAIRKQSKTNFSEDKEKKQWRIYFIGFLKQPLPDLEYVVKIYELAGRTKQLLSTFEQFTDERGQRTLTSNVILERKQFGVNKQLLVTMEYRGRVLASGKLKILGQADKFSGKVDFSEEEAAHGANDE